jgi:uncharacterized membrane protein YfhO
LPAEAIVVRYDPHRIEVKTRSTQEKFLVLSEVYYPRWLARIDGMDTRVYRTNYTLRGIIVPPGEHKIEFVYSPKSFNIGAICSGIGIAVLVFGACITHLHRMTFPFHK